MANDSLSSLYKELLFGGWSLVAFFSKTYPSFLTLKEGSTSHPCPLSSGAREKTVLLGARNRFALRLAGHQSPRQLCGMGPPGMVLLCLAIMDL